MYHSIYDTRYIRLVEPKLMLGQIVSLICAVLADCPVTPDGLVITKYYLEECGACQRIAPVMNEIKDKLEKEQVNVKYREVECSECACQNITSFPTIEITEDRKSLHKLIGYKDYKSVGAWITDKIGLESNIFENHIVHDQGKVTPLQVKDFLTGFDGQWLILFYDNKREEQRENFKKIAEEFENKLSVGEAEKESVKSVTNRFEIAEYPHIVGINHGTPVPYVGSLDYDSIREFAGKLYRPSFGSITYEQLKKKVSGAKNGEPVYVVLYKDYTIASYYFNDLAQQFKFKARIYKSNDPAMFQAAEFHPKDATDYSNQTADYNEMVRLFVYKNGTFFPSPKDLSKGDAIIQWIFHTHFPHVTEITNESFYTVFHGIKPVIVLLTENQRFVGEFNKLSAERHLGLPYSDVLFTMLDVSEYREFKNQVLSGVKKYPAVAFYDPINVKWHYEDMDLNEDTFKDSVRGMIERYLDGKVAEYPPKKSWMKHYVIAAWIVGIIAFFSLRRISEREKIE